MSAPKSSTFMTITVVTLLLSIGYHSVGLAEPWMSMFVDTGLSDTGPATDDTATPADPPDDTGMPSDDTGMPSDTGDDTGSSSEPGDTGDTGDTPEVVDGDDTGAPGKSAAELAGEKGGCGCAAGAAPATGFVWLGALIVAFRRRP